MPAIITHDFFGQDVYKVFSKLIGESRNEHHAFLLGCQGPDPLFYSALVPRLRRFTNLGSTMHSQKTSELLVAFKQSLYLLEPDEQTIGRAYLFGFLCHYALDSCVHPLVYWYENQLCTAGVEGLDEKDRSEVHAVIECEIDEMVLFRKKQVTVAKFSPATEILRGSDFVLSIVSKMYSYVSLVTYGIHSPENMFTSCLKSFRRTERVFHSRSGIKRKLLGDLEEIFRPHSFVRSMSPRALKITESNFDNHERATWVNPFTGEETRADFWELCTAAFAKVQRAFVLIDRETFGPETARVITKNLNFSGESTVAVLTIEDADENYA